MQDNYLDEETAQETMPTIDYEIEIIDILLSSGANFPKTTQWTYVSYNPKLGTKDKLVQQLSKYKLKKLREELVFLKERGYEFYYQKDL